MFDKEVFLPTLDLWIALRLWNLILFLFNATELVDVYYSTCDFSQLALMISVLFFGCVHMCVDVVVLVAEWTFNQLVLLL